MEYGIGELERVLGVKAHVIRYWCKEIPLIQPAKNKYNGRLIYGERDVQLLFRLKHLLYEKKYTVDGAREQLYKELFACEGEALALRAEIASLRGELLNMYRACERRIDEFETGGKCKDGMQK